LTLPTAALEREYQAVEGQVEEPSGIMVDAGVLHA